MRSRSSVLPALLLAAAGCGTWSNEDIAFVEALPTRQALRVTLPSAGGQALCAGVGPSEVWGSARSAGDGINAGVDGMVALVDRVKATPPTTRRRDARVWGPFDDERHPGRQIRVTMTRSRDAAGVTSYAYVFEARAGGDFVPVIGGDFHGESARTGSGGFTLHFDALRALGMNDQPSDPTGDVVVGYDRTGDPRTVNLDLRGDGFNLAAFDYGYAGYASGRGLFHFQFVNGQGQVLTVDTAFDATSAGRASVTVAGPGLPSPLGFGECWDAAGCVTDVKDPQAGSAWFPNGVSGLCAGGVCPSGACPAP